jgi:hypothetical protein
MELKLSSLGQAIAACWSEAEAATARAVIKEHPDPEEEEVTIVFGGKLRAAVSRASRARRFERALIEDVQRSYPEIPYDSSTQLRGLAGRVTFHKRYHEGKYSGADLGIVVRRPALQPRWDGHLEVVRGHARGMLAQAKLGKSSDENAPSSFGQLTHQQKALLSSQAKYYWLLLYRLAGGTRLAPFAWQSCNGFSISEVKDWLRSGVFPSKKNSNNVIMDLSCGRAGTTDPSVIEQVIDPKSSRRARAVEIEIHWPDGTGPSELLVQRAGHLKATQHVRR